MISYMATPETEADLEQCTQALFIDSDGAQRIADEIDPEYECTIGWSLFLKSDLNLMGIKSCALFTELERIVVESLVFYIGKSTPQPNH